MEKHRAGLSWVLLLALLIISGGVVVLKAEVNQEWVARYNGPQNSTDEASRIAVDQAGNVYVTGTSVGVGTSNDYLTIKYNASGVLQWEARYTGPGSASDMAHALAVDADGNVYVTGHSWGGGTTHYDYATIKYSPAGEQLWEARYNGPGYGDDWAYGLALDDNGNVYVTGQSVNSQLKTDFTTIKYNASGNQLWIARYSHGDWGDYAYAIALDNENNVYVTGQSHDSSSIYDYATVKYNSSGAQLWVSRYNGPGNGDDVPSSLAVDANGNVYVTGKSLGNVNLDYATVKYNSAGVQQWVARYNGTGNAVDVAEALALGPDGTVAVTGVSVGSGTGDDYATVKYNTSGNQLWAARYNYSFSYADHAYAIGMDAGSNVYVTGKSASSSTNTDYATIRYDAFGNQLWVQRYNNLGVDDAYALKVDAGNNVYVTGRSTGSGTVTDYATIKYNQNPSIDVELVPVAPPVIIPANGGNFQFDALVQRVVGPQSAFQVWARIQNPDGSYTAPTLGPVSINPPVGIQLSRQRNQDVPGNWSPGVYHYLGYANPAFTYPAIDSSAFPFTKTLVSDQGPWITESSCTGDPFPGEPSQTAFLPSGLDLGISPNPFNPTTVASYELPVASQVSLKIYDTTGRLVATLVDEYQQTGQHSITFNGFTYPSGIYFYRLTAGANTATGKIVLLK